MARKKKKLNTDLDGSFQEDVMINDTDMEPGSSELGDEGSEPHEVLANYTMGDISNADDDKEDEEFVKASKKLKTTDSDEEEDEWFGDDLNLDDTDDFAKYENYDPDNPDEFDEDY
jgi:hypothetical protein